MNFKRLKLNRNIINQTIVGYLGQEIFPVVSNKTGYDIYRYNIDPESILDINIKCRSLPAFIISI